MPNLRTPAPYTTPKGCGGYPHTRECKACQWRWDAPTSGDACPLCSTTERLRKVLKTFGPGQTLDDLWATRIPRDLLKQALDTMRRRGEATRFGAYWWLKVREPKSFPKQPPPPRTHPIETALNQAGIQEENGHIVKRSPRRKP